MELTEYRNIYENEEKHFFYVSTHRLVLGLVKRWFPKGKRLVILDAGCGTGGLAVKLKRFGKVTAVDVSDEAIRFSKKRGVGALKASVDRLPFKNDQFDLVTSVDVIYHKMVDDAAVLKEIMRVLKPGGLLILRVPANKFLMSAHDRHVHTARRYNKNELTKKLHQAGFKIELLSYVHSPIFPISLLRVVWERLAHKSAASTVGKVNPIINTILTSILEFEAELISRGVVMPFGQGLFVVARKNYR